MIDRGYKIFIPLMVYDYILANLDKNLLSQFTHFVVGSHSLDKIYRVDDLRKLNRCPELKISIDNEGQVTLYQRGGLSTTISWEWAEDWIEHNRDICNLNNMNGYPWW